MYIDGNGTLIHRSGTVFSVASYVTATFANVGITPDGGDPLVAATISAAGSLRLYRAEVTGQVTTEGGSISATRSTFTSPMTSNFDGIVCTAGTATVRENVFQRVIVSGVNCQLLVEKNHFDMLDDGSVRSRGGFVRIENNVIVNANELADSMYVTAAAPGSTVRFNTFVNASGIPSDGTALYCDGTPTVTSNIFAFNSMHPLNPGTSCPARYSLFDKTVLTELAIGTGNQVADLTLFFVDLARRDFHLAPASPARASAEVGLDVTGDIEGRLRPAMPDIGAYQGP